MYIGRADNKVVSLQCGRYTTGQFIERHDDAAYKQIGERIYCRDIAVVYYLSPNWDVEDGKDQIDKNIICTVY